MIQRSARRRTAYDWFLPSGVSNVSRWVHNRDLPERYIVAPEPILAKFEEPEYPVDIDHVLDAIRESRRILELEDDWDDEGSPGYTESTWKRATDFLLNDSLRLWQEYRIRVEVPRILPGPDGSIDIHWRVNQRELLINIPASEGELASYYGDDQADGIIKGTLKTSARNQWLMMWLAE